MNSFGSESFPTFIKVPGKSIESFVRKSVCPLQLEAITGFSLIVASNKGLPNPSP